MPRQAFYALSLLFLSKVPITGQRLVVMVEGVEGGRGGSKMELFKKKERWKIGGKGREVAILFSHRHPTLFSNNSNKLSMHHSLSDFSPHLNIFHFTDSFKQK
jgi:hypothetical protein